jgi:uncharacterized protein (TIGR03067 family)
MKKFVVLALVVGFLVGADDPKKDKGKKAATALEGTWLIVSVTEDGKDRNESKDAHLVFQGENLTLKARERERKATFKIDPKKKTIDIIPTDRTRKEDLIKGIYQLKGDDLKLCHSAPGQDRPKDFTAEKGSKNVLAVLKRVKDKGDKNEKKLARVEGKVLLDGAPLAGATVVFVPVNKGGQKATGTTNADGTFELITGGNKKGALPGDYNVVITKKVAGKSVLRAKYGSEKTTPLKFKVQDGGNTIDIDLKSK